MVPAEGSTRRTIRFPETTTSGGSTTPTNVTVMRAVACVPSPKEMAFTSFTCPAPGTFLLAPSSPASETSITKRGGSTSEKVVNDGALEAPMVTSATPPFSATSMAVMPLMPVANAAAGTRMSAAESSVDLRMERSRRAFAGR